MDRLAAPIPPPRFHRARYHGVFALCARKRAHVIPAVIREPDSRSREINTEASFGSEGYIQNKYAAVPTCSQAASGAAFDTRARTCADWRRGSTRSEREAAREVLAFTYATPAYWGTGEQKAGAARRRPGVPSLVCGLKAISGAVTAGVL